MLSSEKADYSRNNIQVTLIAVPFYETFQIFHYLSPSIRSKKIFQAALTTVDRYVVRFPLPLPKDSNNQR